MKNSSIGYIIGSAFRGMKKHLMMTTASVSVLIACMIIIGTAYLFSQNVSNFMLQIEQQNEIVAFIDDAVPEEDYQSLQRKIENIEGVDTVDFVTKDEALEDYRNTLGEDGSYLDSFSGEDNPLRNSFVITISNLELFTSASSKIASMDEIGFVRDTQEIVNVLISLRKVVNILGVWIMLILGLVSLFIISNTIKIAMYNRRTEISIMKYVGATDWFIRWPFIFEGLFIGLIAAVVCFGLQWYIYTYLFAALFEGIDFVQLVPFSQLYIDIIIVFTCIGVLVGVFGSITSIRKYLDA